MTELPDEIWELIKQFTFNWKKTHMKKLNFVNNFIKNQKFGEPIYKRWTYFQPWLNTNEIIDDEYGGDENHPYAPPPNLERTSVMSWSKEDYYIGGHGRSVGWWCGYGWCKFNWRDKNVVK